jgi:glutaminyl-tRNA synthetase
MATASDGDMGAAAPPPLESCLAIGLDQRTAENALANRKVTANLTAVIAEVCAKSRP